MMRISLLDVLEGREVLVLVPSLKPGVVWEEGEQEMKEGRGASPLLSAASPIDVLLALN